MYDKVFFPVSVLQIGCLSKTFFVSILQRRANPKIWFKLKGQFLLTSLKVIAYMHCWALSSVGNQFTGLKSARGICCVLFNLRQKRIYLFCIVCIFLFLFCVRFDYQAVHAWSKYDQIRALQRILRKSVVKN